jgi:hypothetical protein
VELSAELQVGLKEFTAAGAIEIRENGGRVAPSRDSPGEVRGAAEKPLLHRWSENHNLTRRVLAITDHSEQHFALAVERFGRAKPDGLEFTSLARDARLPFLPHGTRAGLAESWRRGPRIVMRP